MDGTAAGLNPANAQAWLLRRRLACGIFFARLFPVIYIIAASDQCKGHNCGEHDPGSSMSVR